MPEALPGPPFYPSPNPPPPACLHPTPRPLRPLCTWGSRSGTPCTRPPPLTFGCSQRTRGWVSARTTQTRRAQGGGATGRPAPQRPTQSFSLRLQGLRGRGGGVSPLHPLLCHFRQQGSRPCGRRGAPLPAAAPTSPPGPREPGPLLPGTLPTRTTTTPTQILLTPPLVQPRPGEVKAAAGASWSDPFLRRGPREAACPLTLAPASSPKGGKEADAEAE